VEKDALIAPNAEDASASAVKDVLIVILTATLAIANIPDQTAPEHKKDPMNVRNSAPVATFRREYHVLLAQDATSITTFKLIPDYTWDFLTLDLTLDLTFLTWT